jgi:ATP-dependent Clp protease ATP-binding subunit ClpC
VLVLAQEEARLLNHAFIGTEHLLLGLIDEGHGVAAAALDSLGLSLEEVRTKVEETRVPGKVSTASSPPFTPRAKKVFGLSLREATQLGHNYIGTEHLLLGLLREGEGVAAQVLVSLGIDLGLVRQRVFELMSGTLVGSAPRSDRPARPPSRTKVVPTCPQCGADLVEAARFRRIGVKASDEGDPAISIEIVYCRQCGVALGTFKSEQP